MGSGDCWGGVLMHGKCAGLSALLSELAKLAEGSGCAKLADASLPPFRKTCFGLLLLCLSFGLGLVFTRLGIAQPLPISCCHDAERWTDTQLLSKDFSAPKSSCITLLQGCKLSNGLPTCQLSVFIPGVSLVGESGIPSDVSQTCVSQPLAVPC